MRIAVLALKNKKLLRELRHRLFKAIDKTERAICVFNKKKNRIARVGDFCYEVTEKSFKTSEKFPKRIWKV